MSGITIGPDGNHEPRQHTEKPVRYLIVLHAPLLAEQAALFEDGDEVILRHPSNPGLIRASIYAARVMK